MSRTRREVEWMRKITTLDMTTYSVVKPKQKVAAYIRVSTSNEDQLISLEAQRRHYKTLIENNDEWQLVDIYSDEGITGTKKDRRLGLLRLISDCEKGKIDFILTKSISRFARNTIDCLELVRKLMDLGVHIYFEKENINTNSMESELMLSILSSLAKMNQCHFLKTVNGRLDNDSNVGLTNCHIRHTVTIISMKGWL